MGADTEKDILLLDSTLSIGGELIDWNYGEHIIPNIRRLSVKSRLDIVEYGLLRRYSLGPDRTIYHSTILPPGFEREQGQYYAILLDRDFWPELSDIPDRSSYTADIIRVLITEERRNMELAYCAALVQKGYQIAVLIDEIGQYEEDELSALLQEMNTVSLWACCLFDASGVLDEESFHTILSLCDKVLNAQVRIGFHGCDNLQCLFELTKSLSQMRTGRGLCVEVSAGGMGTGALHLASAKFAHWMNESFQRAYDLPVLAFQETYTKQYLESKQEPGAQLLYHATAEYKCCYHYAEYYCELSIEPSDQLGIYAEIEREFAFRFDKSAANRALMRYRKKRLNLVVVIPTANRWKAVDSLLFNAVRDLLCYGVDIVIYDSSDDEKTHAVTVNFQMDGYDNVHYRYYLGESDEVGLDKKVMSAYKEHLDYDYIWICRDGLIPTIPKFYDALLADVHSGKEWIVVDGAFRNYNQYLRKEYDNCLDFFQDNSMRTTILGTTIFKNTIIKKVLENWPVDVCNRGFWMPIAPLWEMSKNYFQASLILGDTFIYNSGGASSSFWQEKALLTWADCWFDAVKGLPNVYELAKPSALNVAMSDFHPFHLYALLCLRACGVFTLSEYKKYQQRLFQISDTPKWKYYFAALIPKPLARFILRFRGYTSAHPNRLLSQLSSKLFDLYIRLGR